MLCCHVSQNAVMPTKDEKAAFAKRLQLALRRSAKTVRGATDLSVQFGLHHTGEAVSPQTAHKWLKGRSIPTNDKLETIARWLKVDEHWLHYGPSPARTRAAKDATAKAVGKPPHIGEHQPPYGPTKPTRAAKDGAAEAMEKPPQEVLDLAMKILELPPHRRYLVEELVGQLQDVD